MEKERDFAWDSGHTMHCADDGFLSCAFETFLVLRIDISPINLVKRAIYNIKNLHMIIVLPISSQKSLSIRQLLCSL